MIDSPPVIDDASAGGRLERAAAQLLEYGTYLTDYIRVRGETVRINPPLTLNLAVDETVLANGQLSGATFAANTTYFCYVSNGAAPVPVRLVGSTQAPSIQAGTLSLSAGAGENYRYVGAIRTNAATGTDDSDIRRDVVNHYNRVRKRLYRVAGYVNDDLVTLVTYNTNGWGRYHADALVEWLSDGDAASECALVFDVASNGGAVSWVGLAMDSTNSPTWALRIQALGADIRHCLRGVQINATRGGFSAWNGLANSPGAVNLDFRADVIRNGAAADPASTYLIGSVWS